MRSSPTPGLPVISGITISEDGKTSPPVCHTAKTWDILIKGKFFGPGQPTCHVTFIGEHGGESIFPPGDTQDLVTVLWSNMAITVRCHPALTSKYPEKTIRYRVRVDRSSGVPERSDEVLLEWTVSPDNAGFVSQVVPATLGQGGTQSVSVRMRNTGTSTWTRSGGYKLGSQHPRDNDIWGVGGRVELSATDRIQSGQTKEFTFDIKAPQEAGPYNFRWAMVREGVRWFGDPTDNAVIEVTKESSPVSKASCWFDNADARMMNMLSPSMPDDVFSKYLKRMTGRDGVNTAHLILANEWDGEYAQNGKSYCIYGPAWDWTVNAEYVRLFKRRIQALRNASLEVVLWLLTDDDRPSPEHNFSNAALSNPDKYVADLANAGLFELTSIVVLGLELDEYVRRALQRSQLRKMAHAVKRHNRKVGVHHTNDKTTFVDMADILFYQTAPGKSAAEISKLTKAALSHGKPVNFFELARGPARELCQAALKAGAIGVGNW